jgi:hypothetical protein
MRIETASYADQQSTWPEEGHHILAQYNDLWVVVYQAYSPAIGRFAVEHQWFGGLFCYTRMSWVKPGFLWMMYRSGWGTKPGQEVILAVAVRREFFEAVLARAVSSSYDRDAYPSMEAWKAEAAYASVRVQWDPDHDPLGAPQKRRVTQLGLRGATLREYGREAIVEITDLSELVASQRRYAQSRDHVNLLTPVERVYTPSDQRVVERLKLSHR